MRFGRRLRLRSWASPRSQELVSIARVVSRSSVSRWGKLLQKTRSSKSELENSKRLSIALSLLILASAGFVGCSAFRTQPTDTSGVCRPPTFEQFCSARRLADIATNNGDPRGLYPGASWLVGHIERCELVDDIPAEWPLEGDSGVDF